MTQIHFPSQINRKNPSSHFIPSGPSFYTVTFAKLWEIEIKNRSSFSQGDKKQKFKADEILKPSLSSIFTQKLTSVAVPFFN